MLQDIQNQNLSSAKIDLREVLRYVPNLRSKPIVIVLDSSSVMSDALENYLLEIAVLQSLGVRAVLAFGISEIMAEFAKTQKRKVVCEPDAAKIDAESAKVAEKIAYTTLCKIMRKLSAANRKGAFANIISANPLGILDGVDTGRRGKISRVDSTALEAMLANDLLPIMPPIAHSRANTCLRLNSDQVGLKLTQATDAGKLIFITQKDIWSKRIERRQLNLEQATKQVAKISSSNEKLSHSDRSLISKLKVALEACRGNCPRVHFISGDLARENAKQNSTKENSSLLVELFSSKGVGFMVHADTYQKVRPASTTDINAIYELICDAVRDQELIKRDKNDIEKQLQDYFLLDVDGNIKACVAVHNYAKVANDKTSCKLAELACLRVKQGSEGQGLGMTLARFAEEEARKRNCQKIFAFTTQSANYFLEKLAYRHARTEELPSQRLANALSSKRNSLALIKDLN